MEDIFASIVDKKRERKRFCRQKIIALKEWLNKNDVFLNSEKETKIGEKKDDDDEESNHHIIICYHIIQSDCDDFTLNNRQESVFMVYKNQF